MGLGADVRNPSQSFTFEISGSAAPEIIEERSGGGRERNSELLDFSHHFKT